MPSAIASQMRPKLLYWLACISSAGAMTGFVPAPGLLIRPAPTDAGNRSSSWWRTQIRSIRWRLTLCRIIAATRIRRLLRLGDDADSYDWARGDQ